MEITEDLLKKEPDDFMTVAFYDNKCMILLSSDEDQLLTKLVGGMSAYPQLSRIIVSASALYSQRIHELGTRMKTKTTK